MLYVCTKFKKALNIYNRKRRSSLAHIKTKTWTKRPSNLNIRDINYIACTQDVREPSAIPSYESPTTACQQPLNPKHDTVGSWS